MRKYTTYYLEYILNQKRKYKYSPEARKHYHRQYKKMAENVASMSLDYDIPPYELSRFFKLPRKYRNYCISLVRSKTKKNG